VGGAGGITINPGTTCYTNATAPSISLAGPGPGAGLLSNSGGSSAATYSQGVLIFQDSSASVGSVSITTGKGNNSCDNRLIDRDSGRPAPAHCTAAGAAWRVTSGIIEARVSVERSGVTPAAIAVTLVGAGVTPTAQ
jgi:hypothetical protein